MNKATIYYHDIGDYLSRKEGGKIFGSGSRNPIAITFLVKKGASADAHHTGDIA